MSFITVDPKVTHEYSRDSLERSEMSVAAPGEEVLVRPEANVPHILRGGRLTVEAVTVLAGRKDSASENGLYYSFAEVDGFFHVGNFREKLDHRAVYGVLIQDGETTWVVGMSEPAYRISEEIDCRMTAKHGVGLDVTMREFLDQFAAQPAAGTFHIVDMGDGTHMLRALAGPRKPFPNEMEITEAKILEANRTLENARRPAGPTMR